MMQADVLIVGAGPAGIAAGVRAAGCGRQVTLLDDNLAEGGEGEVDPPIPTPRSGLTGCKPRGRSCFRDIALWTPTPRTGCSAPKQVTARPASDTGN
jgi:2-polyprenyl-6-methoxyphenol hydroxylase-like FAD-dependent oxidoreductase